MPITRASQSRRRTVYLGVFAGFVLVGTLFGADDTAVTRFGPFDPIPLTATIRVPKTITWVDGAHFELVLHNAGRNNVSIEWYREQDQDGEDVFEVFLRRPADAPSAGSWTRALPDLTLRPDESRTFSHYIHQAPRKGSLDSLRIGVNVHARLFAGDVEGVLHVDTRPGSVLSVRRPTPVEIATGVAQVVALANQNGPNERRRLSYLLSRPERVLDQLTSDALYGAYEAKASVDYPGAVSLFQGLVRTRPEEEVLAYAERRVKDGDIVPAEFCLQHLSLSARSQLANGLRSEDPEFRMGALRTMVYAGVLGSDRVVVSLLQDGDSGVRYEACKTVEALKIPTGEALESGLFDPRTARVAADAISVCGSEAQIPALLKALESSEVGLDQAAFVRALGSLGGPVEPIANRMKHPDPNVQAAVIVALGELEAVSHVEEIVLALKDRSGMVRASAALALARLGGARYVPNLVAAAETHGGVAATIAVALGRIGGPEALAALEALATDHPIQSDRGIGRASAVRALVDRVGVEAAVPALRRILANPSSRWRVRQAAMEALGSAGAWALGNGEPWISQSDMTADVLWALARLSAPNLVSQNPAWPGPIREAQPIGDLVDAFPIAIRIRDLPGAAERFAVVQSKSGRRKVHLRDVANAVLHAVGETAGYILTEEELVFVPRAEALAYYRSLLSAR